MERFIPVFSRGCKMAPVGWREGEFDLRRIVVAERMPAYCLAQIRAAANSLVIPVVGDRTDARPGDLWLASYPPGTASHAQGVLWACALEVPDTLRWLQALAN